MLVTRNIMMNFDKFKLPCTLDQNHPGQAYFLSDNPYPYAKMYDALVSHIKTFLCLLIEVKNKT